MNDMDELMKKAEEMEKEMRANMTEWQRDLLDNADKMMLEGLGVSSIDEFLGMSKKEQKKRSMEMNKQLLSMLGMTEEDALRADREMREEAIKERRNAPAAEFSEELYNSLLPLVKNAVFIEAITEETAIKTGQSKIGGKPDLPQGFTWYRNENDALLSFIMQINFAEIHEFDKDGIFPENGIMYIFYDIENQPWDTDDDEGKGFAVFYYDGDISALSPADFPEEFDEDCGYYGFADENCELDERAVRFFADKDLPDDDDFADIYDGETDFDKYNSAKRAVLGYDSYEYSEKYFKLGGYSDTIQHGNIEIFGEDCIQLCELSTYESGKRGFMFGDGGKLYLYISKADLAAKNFNNVKINLQCY